jgi:hypothetical protein
MLKAPLVSFLLAGVQKGGTTALHHYLAEYRDVALGQPKEIHFFDDEAIDWRAPDYEAYHAHFPPADGRSCGEATPIYLYWPKSLERIAAYNPAMQLIVMLRDPVERAWSHWRMEYARGAERMPFAWCVREGRHRQFDATPWGFHREFSYVERGFYGEQLERLFGLFPREQVLVLRTEALRRNPAPILGEVRRFLGLAEAPDPAAREIHVGLDIDYGSDLTAADVEHLRDLFARDQARLQALVGFSYD